MQDPDQGSQHQEANHGRSAQGLPQEKDLIVDMEPFFKAYREVMPFLITDDHPPTRERIQSAEERAIFDDTTKCILCAACDIVPGVLE